MTKSTIKLPNGTIITIEGDPEDIKKVLAVYPVEEKGGLPKTEERVEEKKGKSGSSEDLILNIINNIKDCDETDAIEEKILDRSSQVDRVLLPLYIADKFKSKPSLSSGDIHSVLKELGIKIALPNISNTLRGTAKKYVMGDRRVKKGGGVVRYQISRPGKQYISKILEE